MSLKWKPHTFLASLYFPRKKKKTFPEKRKKVFLNLKFLFLSPPLPPHFNSDQKNLTFALSFSLSLSVWFPIEIWFEISRNFLFPQRFAMANEKIDGQDRVNQYDGEEYEDSREPRSGNVFFLFLGRTNHTSYHNYKVIIYFHTSCGFATNFNLKTKTF